MPYLIDGYNLVYALGLAQKRMGPTQLEKARLNLLGLLRGALGDAATQVTVVFDAAGAPPGAEAEQKYQGIHVIFAVHEDEADDRIEELIRRASAPKQLTVISDDHRIQQAARRRQCAAMKCADFLDLLETQRRRPAAPVEAPKPEVISPQETERWLREFGEIASDERPSRRRRSGP
jgi:predicted RNA-binding protein with PIN domain